MRKKGIELPTETILELVTISSKYSEVEKVVVFGSRVLGNAKPGSDVDLAFSGRELSSQLVSRIQNHLEEETLLPYFFDCVHLKTIKNTELLDHIHTHGKVLYERNL